MQLKGSDWPLFGWTADVRPALRKAVKGQRRVVLGTLVRLEGSAPRPVGTQMLFDGDDVTGYFSGGCLEADVANHAAMVLADGQPRYLVYGQGSPWIDIRLVCGGRMEILLERIDPDDQAVATLLSLEQRRCPVFWSSDGLHRSASDKPFNGAESMDANHGYSLRYDPPWRVIVIGGDPIALAIAQLAATTGFETTLIRPDGPEGPPPLTPVTYIRRSLTEALAAISVDPWTAVVTATHDDSLDDQVLLLGLSHRAGYAGVLGAAKRIDDRNARLSKAGLSADALASIHAPIGAARCGKAPWEVAVSVVAEIMQARAAH